MLHPYNISQTPAGDCFPIATSTLAESVPAVFGSSLSPTLINVMVGIHLFQTCAHRSNFFGKFMAGVCLIESKGIMYVPILYAEVSYFVLIAL